MAVRWPDLARIEGLLPWAQVLTRDLTRFSALRPTISQGNVTLSTTGPTTTITDVNATPNSHLGLMPTNASAAGVDWWVSSRTGGSLQITHPSVSTTRTYAYVIIG